MSAHTEAGNLHRPEVGAFAIDTPEGGITVDVENTDACPRYTGVTVRGVTVKESPKWLKDALSTIGLRPINNIVDITNYLLHGMGQPLHCFDVAKIAGNKIVVKNAKEGEKFVTLDGVEHTLDSRDLMICNTEVPMCIAGVFGGLDSGVTEATTDVFLESAYFNPTSVRKTARRHGLNTDSSFRFERGVDPNNTLYVLKLAALMVKELAGGEICGPLCDNYPSRIEPAEVSLSFEYFDKLIGKHIPADTIVSILKSLEMELTEVTDEKADMKVPTYRVDVTRPCDVAEDVLRIYGYNNVEISSSVRSALSSQSFEDQDNKLRNLISEQLTAEGFNEILNNSLTAEAYYTDLAAYPADHCVRLLNPLSNDLNVMRQTLLFGGLESLSHNINRKMADLAMYEFGNVYFFNPAVEATAEKVLAPYSEASRLAIWLTGALRPGNWARPEQPATVYDMKAVITNILNRLGINPAEIKLAASSCALYSAALDINTRSGKISAHSV